MVAYIAYTLGYKVICVLSGDLGSLASMVADGLDFAYEAVITRDDSNGEVLGFTNALAQIHALDIPIVVSYCVYSWIFILYLTSLPPLVIGRHPRC